MATPKITSTPADFANLTEANGRTLACQMLRKFRETNTDALSIEARYRPGKKQRDILGHTLRTIKKAGNPAVDAGFMAVMNDFIAHTLTTGVMDPEFYEGLDDEEIARPYRAGEIIGEIGGCTVFASITKGGLTLVHSRD